MGLFGFVCLFVFNICKVIWTVSAYLHWNCDSQNLFSCVVPNSCGPQDVFGVTFERWKEAADIFFYTGKVHTRLQTLLQLQHVASSQVAHLV